VFRPWSEAVSDGEPACKPDCVTGHGGGRYERSFPALTRERALGGAQHLAPDRRLACHVRVTTRPVRAGRGRRPWRRPQAGSSRPASAGRLDRVQRFLTTDHRLSKTWVVARFSWTTIKTLFGLSCNVCAMDGCEQRLTDPNWKQVNADIAHIRGERPGAARYDPSMSSADRNAYENLLLLCPSCHRLIDRLEPDSYPVERLVEIKNRHEERCRGVGWATDDLMDRFAEMLLAAADETELETPDAPPPRLEVQRRPRDSVVVVNVGSSDAFDLRIMPHDDPTSDAWVPLGDPPPRLSPGAVFRAGAHAATLGNAGPHAVRLEWRDAAGRQYDADFPLE